MVKCTINGRELEVKPGTTIIEAMSAEKMKIAHYCWHPGLSVAGVCRLCMVEIEGNPRLQLGCNTVITEGMKINNTSEKVKDFVKWGLDFHLINHPLDCPVCDQAGECGLQDQYMEFGKYTSKMTEKKVKKHKVVDLGPRVVLDSERCILCSRCVRFTCEVSKTHELGIFNRGDRSEIGTFEGKPLNNKYSVNVVDICPVGALTSKDFRFRQRVWFLKEGSSVCNGCSTGCNIKVSFNKEGVFRIKPSYNPEVNGFWMCDEGRDIYKWMNRESRYVQGETSIAAVAKGASKVVLKSGSSIALVLTGQYMTEEYEQMVRLFREKTKSSSIYHWVNQMETFDQYDGLLLRGDRNPNTKGLLKVLFDQNVPSTKWSDFESKIKQGAFSTVIVAGPENVNYYPELSVITQQLSESKVENVVWLQSSRHSAIEQIKKNLWIIPMKSYIEKEGSFINHKGLKQSVNKVTTLVSEALSLTEAAQLLMGEAVQVRSESVLGVEANRRKDQVMMENVKKNEFVFRKGTL